MTDPIKLRELLAAAVQGERLFFHIREWENARGPSIVHDDPVGGDPRILGEFARVYRPDALEAVCEVINALPHLLDQIDTLTARLTAATAERDEARAGLDNYAKTMIVIGEAAQADAAAMIALTAERDALTARVEGLEAGLRTYDREVLACPARCKSLGDKPCPKCGATASEGCGLDAGASYRLIASVRALLTTDNREVQG